MGERSAALAARWQDHFDRLIVAAAGTAVLGVALQTLPKVAPGHLLGQLLSAGAWAVFALDAVVMLAVAPERARWARDHAFELGVLVAAFPWWPVLAHGLLVLELLPAFTVVEAAKLAKLVKVVRAIRRRGDGQLGGRLAAAAVVLAAAGVGILVVMR